MADSDPLIPPLRWLTYVGYWCRYRQWPSRMQRLFMQGDPTGEVRALSDAVIADIRAAEQREEKRLADMGWAVAEAVTLMHDALDVARDLARAPELPDSVREGALERLGSLLETADLVLAVTASHIRQAAQP